MKSKIVGLLLALAVMTTQLRKSVLDIRGLKAWDIYEWYIENVGIDLQEASQSDPCLVEGNANCTREKLMEGTDTGTDVQLIHTNSYTSTKTDITESLPPRLELLHIQKNAGSLLEVLALRANISWGTCHFDFPWKNDTVFKDCPPLLVTNNTYEKKKIYWHYPLQYLDRSTKFKVFPYDNHPDAAYVARPKKYFVVVRNPYDRLISSFYYYNKLFGKENLTRGPGAKEYLNKWSQEAIVKANKIGLDWKNSVLCQHQYLYHRNGTKIPGVDHVVQFEYLAEDFNPLAQRYGLNLTIPDKKENARNDTNQNTLTVEDLGAAARRLMNRICKNDFALGRGYPML